MRRLQGCVAGLVMFASAALLSSCEYQEIHERNAPYEVAKIPVMLNWDYSGFVVDSKGFTKQSNAYIHRVTFMLFPKDGGEVIERYIGDGYSINEGFIDVPVGEYSVIVMNESISDSYWDGAETGGLMSVGFENVDSYVNFAAYVNTHTDNPTGYYWDDVSGTDYLFMNSPLRLSTWSLDDFVVTQNMVEYSQSESNETLMDRLATRVSNTKLSKAEEDMFYALCGDTKGSTDGITMRKLTYDIEVKLQVNNLTSVSAIKGGLIGFTNKVNMRTGRGFREPTTKSMIQYFTFNGRSNWYNEKGEYMGDGWSPSSGDNIYEDYSGQTSVKFLSFGRDYNLEEQQGANPQKLYNLDLDFLYISGELMQTDGVEFLVDLDNDPTTEPVKTPLPFDLTSQAMKSQTEIGTAIDIDMRISTIELDYVTGSISVEDWEEEPVIPL